MADRVHSFTPQAPARVVASDDVQLVWHLDQAGAECALRVREASGGPVLECTGEICLTTVEPLGVVLFELANRRGPSLRLDMRGVSFIDARGITLLVRLHHAVTDLGGRLEILDPSPQVRRLLTVAQADHLLDTITDSPARRAPR